MAESKEENKTCTINTSHDIMDLGKRDAPSSSTGNMPICSNRPISNTLGLDLSEIIYVPSTRSTAPIDLTLECNQTIGCANTIPSSAVSKAGTSDKQLIDLSNASSSFNNNNDAKARCTILGKHKIFTAPAIEDCSLSKIPSIGSDVPSFINLSNSTITSANQAPENMNLLDCRSSKEKPNIKSLPTPVPLTNPQIYYQVLEIFPDVEKNYLSNLCNTEIDLNNIINIILEANLDYSNDTDLDYSGDIDRSVGLLQNNLDEISPLIGSNSNKITGSGLQISSQNNEPLNSTADLSTETHQEPIVSLENNQLRFLTEVLPDADPLFLETKSNLTESELREFIYDAMEKQDYPKLIIKKVPENKEDEELGLYTTDFDLERFLRIFPEPFKYFLDKDRKCEKSVPELEFLKMRLRNHTVKVIQAKYKELGYNMSRTHDALENLPQTRNSKRPLNETRIPKQKNLPFLQEVCFVEHKAEIKAYIDSKAEAKQLSFQQAKDRGELIECQCCFDESLFEDCAACNEGDLFCKGCIKRSAEVRIGDGLNTFPCLVDCGAQFSLQLMQNILDANTFSRLLRRIQLEEVRAADIDGLEVCPFCEFATIPPPETNIFTCLNPECLKESCRKCHKESHIPQRCEEVESDDQARARKYIEDEMTKALVRECYKCKKSFIKVEGCNKMTCTCGARMCYICRQPVVDYKHFNGPGGAEKDKCPLYSTDKVLHVDAVKVVGEEALQKMNAANPSLQLIHDPTKILPSTSVKSYLPQGVREDPAVLLQRLQGGHPQRPQEHTPPVLPVNGTPNRPLNHHPPIINTPTPNHNAVFPNVRQTPHYTAFDYNRHAAQMARGSPNVPNRNPVVPYVPQTPYHNPVVPYFPRTNRTRPVTYVTQARTMHQNYTPAVPNVFHELNHRPAAAPNPPRVPNNPQAPINELDLPLMDLEELRHLDDLLEQTRMQIARYRPAENHQNH